MNDLPALQLPQPEIMADAKRWLLGRLAAEERKPPLTRPDAAMVETALQHYTPRQWWQLVDDMDRAYRKASQPTDRELETILAQHSNSGAGR